MTDMTPRQLPDVPTTDYRLQIGRHFLTRWEHLGGHAGIVFTCEPREEGVLLVLTGRVTVNVTNGAETVTRTLGERGDVFSGLPYALVMAPGDQASVRPETDAAEVVFAHTGVPEAHTTRSAIVTPAEVRVHQVGEASYKRTVREVVGETQGATTRLCCGETLQDPGMWSSWPHHEFDRRPDLATQFDEIFYVFAKPLVPSIEPGEVILRRRGLMVDGSAVDDVLALRNGQEARVPLGHHPIAAPLDSRLCYVWFYAGPPELKKRYAKRAKDNGYYA